MWLPYPSDPHLTTRVSHLTARPDLKDKLLDFKPGLMEWDCGEGVSLFYGGRDMN